MESLFALWLPILVSAVFVFIVSAIIHMLIPYHRNDFKKLANENEVMEALRPFNIAPGDYFMPHAGDAKDMKTAEYKEKATKGPMALMTVLENGMPKMATNLMLWFVYSVIVSFFAAYVTSRAVTPETHYLTVFRFAGATAFGGYSLALLQNSIWYKRNWCATFKSMFDGLIYALVTAGVFGWLWPRG